MVNYTRTSENFQSRALICAAQVEPNITLQEYYSKHEILKQSLLYELLLFQSVHIGDRKLYESLALRRPHITLRAERN